MAKNRQIKRQSRTAGLTPGTLVHIGEKKSETVKMTLMDYNEQSFQEKVIGNVEECFPYKATGTTTWINIDGLHQLEIIEKLGQNFDIHPLILEDILNTGQRPKCEDYEKYMFIVLKMLSFDEVNQTVRSEQVSLILGQNFVISFQEEQGDVFEQIRDRIRNAKGRIRKTSADYLAYALLDAVVDNYFIILEKISEQIETMEEKLIRTPDEKILHEIHSLKRELISLRKSV